MHVVSADRGIFLRACEPSPSSKRYLGSQTRPRIVVGGVESENNFRRNYG